MCQQQKSRRVSKGIYHQISCFFMLYSEPLGGLGDRIERRFKRRIQHFVALFAETTRLHAAAEQVESQVEISGVLGIVAKECHRCRAKSIGRSAGPRDGTGDSLAKISERIPKNLRVNFLL